MLYGLIFYFKTKSISNVVRKKFWKNTFFFQQEQNKCVGEENSMLYTCKCSNHRPLYEDRKQWTFLSSVTDF